MTSAISDVIFSYRPFEKITICITAKNLFHSIHNLFHGIDGDLSRQDLADAVRYKDRRFF